MSDRREPVHRLVRRTFWPLTPVELRELADECERRDGFYVELLDMEPGEWIKAKLDDEAGGEEFTITAR